MEEEGGGCGDDDNNDNDDNNACVIYEDRANENATKALSVRGVQGGGNFWMQSTIKLELGMEREGAHVQMTMTAMMRPGEKNTQQPTLSSGRTQRAIEGERDGGEGSRQ